jgi:preprotein translocase subunit SecF
MIAALARTIYNHPDIPTGMAIVLGIAALLCVAPTILNLAIKLPGGTEISLVKDQLKDQAQQIKNDVGSQGADVRAQIVALAKRLEVLERGTAAVPQTAEKQQFDNNRAKTVVVLYADGRKDLATQMQDFLLQKGYSASTVYTDFTELSEENRLSPGTVAFVSAETDSSLRNEVEKTLRARFSQVLKVVDATASKLASNAVQVRLF